MHTLRSSGLAALVATLTFVAAPARADFINLNFHIATPNGNPVSNLVIYSAAAGQDNVHFSPQILAPSGAQTLSHSVPFSPASILVVGLNPGVGGEGDHVIMFTNTAFAADAVGLKWSELFSVPRHSELLRQLANAHAGDPLAIASVTAFLRGPDAAGAAFDPNGPYSIVQFSTVPPPIGGNIPEPHSIALLGVALASLVVGRKRKT